ncbi:hypothetical protein GE09DRAFT_1140517 [Coniochaeta sp. 2T2.1]|nr:hypothetical protein GE09DRAFT_1140517 [Coniochaeta sp. 2T2.1]
MSGLGVLSFRASIISALICRHHGDRAFGTAFNVYILFLSSDKRLEAHGENGTQRIPYPVPGIPEREEAGSPFLVR